MTFRKDINGLRAIAVLVVVLFHFKIPGFDGGFAGVDIFFVISGYLMTSLIFIKLTNNNFSIINFYLARARRIIPALAVLCFFIIIIGFYYFSIENYQLQNNYIRKSILFISNISFSRHINYFSSIPEENWLLHTWSLSVEWQFYILYPIIITVIYKLTRVCFIKEITEPVNYV